MSVENTTTEVTSTEFRAHSGQYIEEAGKRPVYITKHGRPVRVLIDVEEYERLRAQEVKSYRLDQDELPPILSPNSKRAIKANQPPP